MRLKIVHFPTTNQDGLSLNHLHVGAVCDVRPHLAGIFLQRGWAEKAPRDEVSGLEPRETVALRTPVVLVVDDDQDGREVTDRLLTTCGYRVVLAADGLEAMAHLRQQRPDLILLDLHMPVMNGWQFRAEQRSLMDKALAAVPVVLVTGESEAAGHTEALRAVGFLRKPVEPHELLTVIATAMYELSGP